MRDVFDYTNGKSEKKPSFHEQLILYYEIERNNG